MNFSELRWSKNDFCTSPIEENISVHGYRSDEQKLSAQNWKHLPKLRWERKNSGFLSWRDGNKEKIPYLAKTARTEGNTNSNGPARDKNAPQLRPVAKKSPKKFVKPAVYGPGVKSLLEIRKFLQWDKLIKQKALFHRVLDESLMDLLLKNGREATR